MTQPASNLTETDLAAAARRLGIELAAMRAICDVESNGKGFLADGRPVILFERHIMYRQLVARGVNPKFWVLHRPDLVNRQPGGYKGGVAEYDRLNGALGINAEAAIESCSWGLFQIMGMHWRSLGYASPDAWRQAMGQSAAAQLDAFVRFLLKNPAMVYALRERRFADFARRYNGPNYAQNQYDLKLATAYARYRRSP